jgi:pyruvate-formate lyase-activating enzyme
MKLLDTESRHPIVPGETLDHPDYQKAIKIVDAVQTHDQHFEFLAVGQFD